MVHHRAASSKNQQQVLVDVHLSSPTSVVTLAPIAVDREDSDFPSFTDIWDVVAPAPPLVSFAPLRPQEIQIANLGPGTREAKGICASTATCSLRRASTTEVSRQHLPTSATIKPCLKTRHSCPSHNSTTLPTVAYRPPRPVKLVRFSVKARRSRKFKPVVRTQAEAKASWWSRNELKKISTRELDVARCFLSRSQKYAAAIQRVLLECFKAASISPGQHQCVDELTTLSYGEALRTVVKGHRGFEQSIIGRLDISVAKLCYRIGKRCIGSVLDAQRRCKEAGATSQQTAAELAAQQGHFSAFAAKFAQMMGEGDAIVALHVQGNRTPFLTSVALQHGEEPDSFVASQQLLEV